MRVQGLPLGAAGTAFTQNFSVSAGTIAGNLGDFDTSTVATLTNPGTGIFDVTNPTCIKAAGANPNTTIICDPALAVVASGNLIYEAFTIAALTKIVQLPGPRAL